MASLKELSTNDKRFLCFILKNRQPYTEKLTEKEIINIWNGVEYLHCLNLPAEILYDGKIKDFYARRHIQQSADKDCFLYEK